MKHPSLKAVFISMVLLLPSVGQTQELPKNIPVSKGHFIVVDLRKESRSDFLRAAEGAASTGRISLALKGESQRIEDAIRFSGQEFSKNVHDVKLLLESDYDRNPNAILLSIHAQGMPVSDMSRPGLL